MRSYALLFGLIAVLVTCQSTAAAFSLRSIGSFDQPISVSSNPGDPNDLLIGERPGRVVESGPTGTRQLLDITSLVSCCEVERGLLSIEPAPDFGASGRIYIAYTGTPAAGGAEGDVHVDSFLPDSQGEIVREPILTVDHAQEANHNGGQLRFGPDGHLYISLGDGGGTGDPFENAQDTEELLGKILRIEPHPSEAPPYAIPAGNPFGSGPGREEIWAYGLRNPWRFSFDRLSGDMVIGDVGQGSREEVDFAPSSGPGAVGGAGANYGWNCREGLIAYSDPATACATAGALVDPVFDYVHQNPADGNAFGCSIIGGYVVRDANLPDLYGRYVYADYCVGQIRSLVLPASAAAAASGDRSEGYVVANPTSFGEDSCGRLYIASEEGPVYRFEGPTPASCGLVQPSPPASASSSARVPRGKRGQLLLKAKRLRPGGSRFSVSVRLDPCRDEAGQPLRLNRNGEGIASKRLNRRCRARFRLKVSEPTLLRAFLRLGGEGEQLASERLRLRAPRPR